MEKKVKSDLFWKGLAAVLLLVLVGMVVIDYQQDHRPKYVYRQSQDSPVRSEFASLSAGVEIDHSSIYWVADLAEQALPFVVNIKTVIDYEVGADSDNPPGNMFDFFNQREFGPGTQPRNQPDMFPPNHPPLGGEGSGFIIREDGYIVTNAHVVAPPNQSYFGGMNIEIGEITYLVRFYDGQEMEAELVGYDNLKDIAVLKIDAKDLPTAVLGNSEATRIGEPVVAIGSPLGYEATVTAGILSTNKRSIEDLGRQVDIRKPQKYLQTDAAINQGNSGGPLLNAWGEVIGINQAITRLDPSMGNFNRQVLVEGIGFAIPIDEVKGTIEQLVLNGKVVYPGIQAIITSVPDYLRQYPELELEVEKGVYVVSKDIGGPADKAGIEAGDVILSIDGLEVETGQALIEAITKHQVGDRVTLRVARSGGNQQVDITVVLGELDLSDIPID